MGEGACARAHRSRAQRRRAVPAVRARAHGARSGRDAAGPRRLRAAAPGDCAALRRHVRAGVYGVGWHQLRQLVRLRRPRPQSGLPAGSNVLPTSSLTKSYGLAGLRAGWVLGPREMIRRAWSIQDLLANNGVAPGEQMTLAAFARLPAIRRRAPQTL